MKGRAPESVSPINTVEVHMESSEKREWRREPAKRGERVRGAGQAQNDEAKERMGGRTEKHRK